MLIWQIDSWNMFVLGPETLCDNRWMPVSCGMSS